MQQRGTIVNVITETHRRDGWTTPLEDVEICPEAAAYKAAGFHALAQQAQADFSNLADRFYPAAKEPWTTHFTREVDVEAYTSSAPPAEMMKLAETLRKQGATRVYFRLAKNGEILMFANVPTSKGDRRVRVAQWAPEGLCTELSEIKRANRVVVAFTLTLAVLLLVLCGIAMTRIFTGSGGTYGYTMAGFAVLCSMWFSVPIRRKLISKSKQARAATS